MKVPAALLSLLAVALVTALPAVQAAATAQALVAPAEAACAARSTPPCGYITPIVDMQFDGKPKCSGSAASLDLSKCIKLPAKGESVSFDGTFRYYWKLSEDLTYPPGQDPVVVSFSGVSTNPKWLTFKVEPATLTIDAVALMSPQNMRVDNTNPAAPIVYYDFHAPLKVTFTHSGDPDADAIAKVAAKAGAADVFVKAKSSASGAYFKEGFGVETFRFDASSVVPPASHASPGGFLAPLAGLAVALLARRRIA